MQPGVDSIAAVAADEQHLLGRLRLASVPGLGSPLRRRLLARFGSAEAIFAADQRALTAVEKVTPTVAAAITEHAGAAAAEQLLADCRRHRIDILPEGSPGYPRLLSQIDDPPDILYLRGQLEPTDGLAVAIVGARHATAYGKRAAEQLAGGLARAGCTVISGLARGIDAAAHRGAIAAGGRTLAVLGSGLLEVYPPEHHELALEVSEHGAVISECPPFAQPHAGAFPRRNRIVSGLSLGTVVVQASGRSGALITARLAGEQGREVFAVPGPIDCRVSAGCHKLIRDGATLVTNVDEILEELGPLFETVTDAAGREVRHPAELQLDELERQVLDAIDRTADGDPTADIDAVGETADLEPSRLLATLAALEIRRLIRRIPGNRVERV
jgi:DNA processing protein